MSIWSNLIGSNPLKLWVAFCRQKSVVSKLFKTILESAPIKVPIKVQIFWEDHKKLTLLGNIKIKRKSSQILWPSHNTQTLLHMKYFLNLIYSEKVTKIWQIQSKIQVNWEISSYFCYLLRIFELSRLFLNQQVVVFKWPTTTVSKLRQLLPVLYHDLRPTAFCR